MAYDEGLAQRIREALAQRPLDGEVRERKMFGGLAFLYEGNMFVGVTGDDLMVRVGADAHAQALSEPHARAMDFTGRPMKGYVFVGPEGLSGDEALVDWLERALAFVKTLPPK